MSTPPGEGERTRLKPVPRLSLRNKLLAFAAGLVLLPGLALGAIALGGAGASLERAIGRQLAREAGHTAERLAAVIRREQETLASFARQDLMREVRVGDIDKRVSAALATLAAGSAGRAYGVLDAEGRPVAASDPGVLEALPAWAAVAGLGANSEPRLVGPLAGAAGSAQRVVMKTPIPDPDDSTRRLGTLVGLFDWTALTAAAASVQDDLATQGLAAEVLVCSAAGEVLGGEGAGGVELAHDIAGAARMSLGVAPDFVVHGASDSIIGRAALRAGAQDWRVLVVVPRERALAPVASLRRRVALAMGLALLVALAAGTLAAGRVVRPLSELTAAVRGLARGEARARSVPIRSDDEIGALAGAFNQMSADLARAQHDLVEAEKFAFVGELAAGVAHEIRTSLGVLRSSTQMLERSLPEGARAEARELAEMIQQEVGRLGGVVDDLLTLRARPLRLEAVPLSQPLGRAAGFVEGEAQAKGIRVERAALPAREARVACDPELIYQVGVNLMVNAIHALPASGTVRLRVLEPAGGAGGFEVCDDGPGVPEEIRERIFQPFVTGRAGGVGLGLTFVKRVVHDHRGRIELESNADAGTCFRVWLPLAEAT